MVTIVFYAHKNIKSLVKTVDEKQVHTFTYKTHGSGHPALRFSAVAVMPGSCCLEWVPPMQPHRGDSAGESR